MANAIGPDVSFYQDDPETERGIDFVKMDASADFVIIRTGQNLWVDPAFKFNWREARLAGLPRGSYWFYDSRVEPKRQAELWVQQFAGDYGELPLFADFEEAYGGIYKGWKNWYTFLERVKSLVGGKEIGIYTAFYYWRDNAPGGFNIANLEYFHQYPLWIANYGVAQPAVPKPWKSDEWLFWQFTEGGDGKLFGVESNGIDMNYFNGDKAKLKIRFKIPDNIPPPPPPPDDGGTPTGKMYKVTALALKVREGPGLSYNAIGRLYLDEIVEEIGATSDRSWLRVRKSDGGLSGWSFAAYLQSLDVPPPPPDGGGTPTGKMFRVIASALNVRDAPDLGANTLGVLPFGEIVEEIGATADRSWLRIRQQTGSLRGWCFAAYLQDAAAPPPPPPPVEGEPQPIPADETKKWYRVTAATVSIRIGPNAGAKIVGTFVKEDSVPALDDTSNPAWVQVRRIDGLTGWCEKKSLILRGLGRPTSFRQKIYTGVYYTRKEITDPRKNVIHAIGIDLQTVGLDFLVTPPSTASGILCTRTTSKFLKEFGMHIAINGDGFSYPDPATTPPNICAAGDPVLANGYAVSRRKVYSMRKTADPIVYFNQRNQVTINEEKGQVVNAVSGDRLIVDGGKVVKNLAAAMLHPRTALGVNKIGRWLTLVVVDGRQPGYSEGMTFPELADQMISFGAFTAVNMDGGSSSTMIIRGVNGEPLLVNRPIESNTPGKQSPVANHLGIFLKNG